MNLFKGTAVYLMSLFAGILILSYLIVKGPRIPILIGFVAVLQIVPISYLARQFRRNSVPKAPERFTSLPRPDRRDIQRKLRKANRLMQQHPCGMHRDRIRELLDEVEERTGIEIFADQVPKLLVAISTNSSRQNGRSVHHVA